MAITLIIVGAILIFLITLKLLSINQFHKEISTLFAQSQNLSNKVFSFDQLKDLPAPAQRYFRHVLKEGQPYISYVRLTHEGQFKTSPKQDWVNIKGEQYFTTSKPGFIWKGSTRLFAARDMYIEDKGKLIVSLFSLFKITGGEGKKYDQGELLRWLAESVWFPTNLLPHKHLQWLPIDNHEAQLNFQYKGFSLSYEVSFNEAGEITEMRTKRYMGDEGLETWIGKVTGYKQINGMSIPTTIEAIYRLRAGDYPYARFTITKIEYDIPQRF